jgi:competence protein ComEC
MVLIVLLLRAQRRQPHPWRLLLLAAGGLTVLWPREWWGPGLQLSCAAVVGILAARPRHHWWQGALQAGWGATVATAPLVAHWFGGVALVGVGATVIVGPWVCGLLVPGSTLVGLLDLAGASAAADLGWRGLGPAAGLLLWTAEGAARLPGGYWPVPPSRVGWLGVTAVGALVGLHGRSRWTRVVTQLPWLVVLAWPTPPVVPPRVTFLPVGHGDAAVIEDGRWVAVVDTGRASATQRVVLPFLRARGHDAIDRLVLSHPDDDHDGGAALLQRAFRVRQTWTPDGRPGGRGLAGRLRPVGPSPPPDWSDNDRSLVLRWHAPGCDVLFTGDIEERREHVLAPHLAPVDVIKVPHHGSSTSSSPALRSAAGARWAIVSAGRSRFGLPNPEVLAAYRRDGSAVRVTDDHGQIEVRCEPSGIRVRTPFAPLLVDESFDRGIER